MSRVRIIIYGEHTQGWMKAFAPDAPVWQRLPSVAEVLMVPDAPALAIAPPTEPGLRTVVIPLMEKHAQHCPRELDALVASFWTIHMLGNKAAFAAYMSAQGLDHLCPARFASPDVARFPCVVKRTDLNAGKGVAIANDRPELDAMLQDKLWRNRDVVLQEVVAGRNEYVTHGVCVGGRIVWHTTFASLLPEPQTIRTAREVLAAHTVPTPAAVLTALSEVLLPLRYSGPFNIDYKFRETGGIAIFELNPRIGGSLLRPEKCDDLASMLDCIIARSAPAGGGVT